MVREFYGHDHTEKLYGSAYNISRTYVREFDENQTSKTTYHFLKIVSHMQVKISG